MIGIATAFALMLALQAQPTPTPAPAPLPAVLERPNLLSAWKPGLKVQYRHTWRKSDGSTAVGASARTFIEFAVGSAGRDCPFLPCSKWKDDSPNRDQYHESFVWLDGTGANVLRETALDGGPLPVAASTPVLRFPLNLPSRWDDVFFFNAGGKRIPITYRREYSWARGITTSDGVRDLVRIHVTRSCASCFPAFSHDVEELFYDPVRALVVRYDAFDPPYAHLETVAIYEPG